MGDLYEGMHVNMPGAHSRCFVSASLPFLHPGYMACSTERAEVSEVLKCELAVIAAVKPALLPSICMPIWLEVKLRPEQVWAGQRAG